MTVPANQITDAQQLLGDGYVDLFQVNLYGGGALFLKADHSETWNGQFWEGVGLKLTGVGTYGNEQVARPRLMMQNPDAAFSPFVSQGALDTSLVTRFRVLLADLRANNPVYVNQTWQVGRVLSCNRFSLTLELRGLADAPNAIVPAQTYSPPKYPTVSL